MSIENKISTRDLTKLIIFGFLQIPYLFLFGWNVIPILILLTGFLLAKRDKLLTTMKKSILFCKCYIILTFIICLIPFKLTKITKHAKRHFWLNDVCTCHGLLPSHSA